MLTGKRSWFRPWKKSKTYLFYLILYIIYCAVFYVGLGYYFFYRDRIVSEPFEVKPSTIHGQGVFSTENYEPNQEIFLIISKNDLPDDTPVKEKFPISDLGLKVNHCSNLDKINVHLVEKEDGWYLHSKTTISVGDELIVDYNNNRPWFIKPAEDGWTC